jgi:hypothetical protein
MKKASNEEKSVYHKIFTQIQLNRMEAFFRSVIRIITLFIFFVLDEQAFAHRRHSPSLCQVKRQIGSFPRVP